MSDSSSRGPTRRSVIVAGAWAVPVIAAAVAVPSAAASDGIVVQVQYPIIDVWMDGDTYFFVTDAGTPVAVGALSLAGAGGFIESEPAEAPIQDGWAQLPLRAIHPGQGDVAVLVIVTIGAVSVTKTLTLTIKTDPGWSSSGAGLGTEAEPFVIAGGATAATYDDDGATYRAGPQVLITPNVDVDVQPTLTDVTGLLDPGTMPPADFDYTTSFYPLGAGGFGAGQFRMDLARNGYSAQLDFEYRVDQVDFAVHQTATANSILFAGGAPFNPPLTLRIDNGLLGVLAFAEVVITDLSGKFDAALSGFGSVATPLEANDRGVVQTMWYPIAGATGTGTARFVISNGGYSQTLEVTYTLPA